VACNGDNSLAVIDVNSASPTFQQVVKQIPVGYFPYGVSVNRDGSKVFVSNWGVTEYKFANVAYDANKNLTSLLSIGNQPDGFYVPPISIGGKSPKTSSVSVISVPGGAPVNAAPLLSIYEGQPGGIDALYNVGDTHPSATAIVRRGALEVLYVCKANNDSIGMVLVNNNRVLPDFDLAPMQLTLQDNHKIHGAYPDAIVVSPDNTRAYIAEAGINSVVVLDTTVPNAPKLLGRIPTGWYPTGLSISSDGKTLFVINAKGVGEDTNPNAAGNPTATGVESFADGNYIFGTVQKIDLTALTLDNTTVLANNFAINVPADTSIVPAGGAASSKIKHVFFILGENKTFDTYLGNQPHFGNYASTTFNTRAGGTTTLPQFTGVVPNYQMLANKFAAAANYYSDSEESDAGHQYAASGTASDYTEKTLLVKGGRGLLVNKNFEPEDYPEGGYIFNNAARNGVDFRLYGLEAARIIGTDTGGSNPASISDPKSGKAGYPQLPVTNPVTNVPGSDVTSDTQGVGQTFFMKFPGLAVLGLPNASGLGRLDTNYPGYNFNISDQRRALEFCKDFKNMLASKNLPPFLYIYLPNSHTGTPYTATNIAAPSAAQQVADSDVALGMVVQQIMSSSVYYNQADGTGSAIFVTTDDAQSNFDHIDEHRTPLLVISPYARLSGDSTGYVGKKHYSTASIVKTEELLLGLPPNNLGDLLATDLRDLFQPTYNGITAASFNFNSVCKYTPTREGLRIWALANRLDLSSPDRDSRRLGVLTRLSMQADTLHKQAAKQKKLATRSYRSQQNRLYAEALKVVNSPAPRDDD
jgi:DNA-binding beta-propeller fold protein YncE